MAKKKIRILLGWMLALSFPAAYGQTPQQLIQRVVDSERAADQKDHANWIYLEESDKPKEHVVQWVAATQAGNVNRVLEHDAEELPETQQREEIDKFLHDPKAQNKQVVEIKHDYQQIDDLMKLLPVAFVWTITSSTETTATLHFAPSPTFHPPTRTARVFSSMTGEVVVDTQQNRIATAKGHLMHDVTFGGGLLGRLKERSSFSLEQRQVAPGLWELTGIHVHLEGNALLFKSVSLQEDDKRTRYQLQAGEMSLEQAAATVMNQPSPFGCIHSAGDTGTNCSAERQTATGRKP